MKPVNMIISPLDWEKIGPLIKGRSLSADSRQLNQGEVFLAFPGVQGDGRNYIASAIQQGASAIVWDKEQFEWNTEWQVANAACDQLGLQVGLIAAHAYGYPSDKMQVIGVTGSNGKTSITHWLAQAFHYLGLSSAVIGTIGNGFIDSLAPATLTTPDALTLQRQLASYVAQGATHLTMEVSSHALMQGRAHGVAFDIAVLTNLSYEHLDYHGSMENYGQAKAKLFNWEGLKASVINIEDKFGEKLISTLRESECLSYGLYKGDIYTKKLDISLDGLMMEVVTPWGKTSLWSSLMGRFNAYNLLASLGSLLLSGIRLERAIEALEHVLPATGRMQKLGGGFLPLVIVDYAHTPDALEKTLSTLRETMVSDGKLYCVFGCGGGRDRRKRALMAQAAQTYADVCIVTSDNPRMEDPESIIQDIVKGFTPGYQFITQSDRKKAIQEALHIAQAQDIVLIAGKGHETYQDRGGVRYDFNDVTVASFELERIGRVL